MEYIVKVTESGTEQSAYQQFPTEGAALEFYKRAVSKYPHLLKFEMYKAEKVELPAAILEESLKVADKKIEVAIREQEYLNYINFERGGVR